MYVGILAVVRWGCGEGRYSIVLLNIVHARWQCIYECALHVCLYVCMYVIMYVCICYFSEKGNIHIANHFCYILI